MHSTKKMQRYQHCCGLTSVSSGSKAIAIFGIIATTYAIIYKILLMMFPSHIRYIFEQESKMGSMEYLLRYNIYVIGAYLSVAVLSLILHGCMLYGIWKERPIFVLAWLIFHWICLMVSTCSGGLIV